MHSKRSLEQGKSSSEAYAKRASGKRLTVDQRQQSRIPKVKYLEFGSEREEIAPSKTSGLSKAHAKGRLTEQKAKGRNRRELIIPPPQKPIRNAILVQTSKDGISHTTYFSHNQNPHKFQPPKSPTVLDDAEHELLQEGVQSDYKGKKVGLQDDEKVQENWHYSVEPF